MRTNRFKIISKMNTMVYGLPLRLEAIRYNIGLDTNRMHYSLYATDRGGNPTGVEVHKGHYEDDMVVFNDAIYTTEEKFSVRAMELLKNVLRLFISKTKNDLSLEGETIRGNLTIKRSEIFDVFEKRVSTDQIMISFGRFQYRENIMTLTDGDEFFDFEIHGKDSRGSIITYGSSEELCTEEANLLKDILDMFIKDEYLCK